MKKLIIFILFLLFVWATPAMAGGGCWYNCADATATVKNSGNSAVAVGNTVLGDTFSPKAINDVNVDINNRDTNINTNIGHNEQGQMNNWTQTYQDSRELLPSQDMVQGVLGVYTGDYTSNGAFSPVEKMIMLKKTFSYEGALETFKKPYKLKMTEARGHSYNGRHEDDPTPQIDVYMESYPKNVRVIGYVTAFATKKGKGKITSFMVLQRIIRNAAIAKGQAVLVTGQGFGTIPKSFGWTAGFTTTGSVLNEQGNRAKGANAGGGPGFASATAELWTVPYITAQILEYTPE